MKNDSWEKIQMFIDSNQVELVVHHLIEHLKNNLTPEQFEQLGDIRAKLIRLFTGDNKPEISAKEFMNGFIDLIKKGAITGIDGNS